MLAEISRVYDVSLQWLVRGEGPRSASAIAVAGASDAASASDVERLVRLLSSDELRDLAERRAVTERAMLEGPMADALAKLREIAARGDVPMRRVQELVDQAIREGQEESRRTLHVVDPPVQREGHVEQVERTLEVIEERVRERSPKRGRSGGARKG